MENKTTKKELVKQVATSTNVSQATTASIINALLEQIGDELAAGKTVEIRRFGTFSAYTNKQRIVNNISGEQVTVPEHQLAKYRCGSGVREKLNKE